MTRKIIYPGTFDPITNGHLDLIQRATKIFAEVVVAVAGNDGAKQHLFTYEERLALTTEAVLSIHGVRVVGFKGLLVHFMQQEQAFVILRGVRAVSDFEYEIQLANMNRNLSTEIETLFLIPSAQYMMLSSSLVREIALLGGDISKFVPPNVDRVLKTKVAFRF